MGARVIFFGSPAFAVPCLEAAVEVAEVVAVVTQPDRPAGRGMALKPPPVKARAVSLGIDVLQPSKVRTDAFAARLRELEADVGVVVAYGRILPPAVLEAPRLGCVNVHASLLPRWRGAAPIHWAIVHGDRETGVCLMRMDEGMDTGPVLSCDRTPVGPDETAGELSERLSVLGAGLLRRDLPAYVAGELTPEPQAHEGATMAPMLRKEHGHVDWRDPAPRVHDRVRGMSPWPGAFTELAGRRVKIHRTRVAQAGGTVGAPGQVVRAAGDALEVACGEGSVMLEELQLEGRKRLSARQSIAGRIVSPGTRFGGEAHEDLHEDG